MSEFPLFNIGRARELKNVIIADTAEAVISIFDYKYTTGHGKSQRNRRQTVVAVRSPELRIPIFHLRPEGMLDTLGDLLRRQDIDFVDHPEFSKLFVLKSESEDETRDFFDSPLLDFFASHRHIAFEASSGVFLYYRRWKRVAPTHEDLRNFLGEGLAAFRAINDRLGRR